jgi:hypothetical protein
MRRASRVVGIWRPKGRTCYFPWRSWRWDQDYSCSSSRSLCVFLVLLVSYMRHYLWNTRSKFLTFPILKNKRIPCRPCFLSFF